MGRLPWITNKQAGCDISIVFNLTWHRGENMCLLLTNFFPLRPLVVTLLHHSSLGWLFCRCVQLFPLKIKNFCTFQKIWEKCHKKSWARCKLRAGTRFPWVVLVQLARHIVKRVTFLYGWQSSPSSKRWKRGKEVDMCFTVLPHQAKTFGNIFKSQTYYEEIVWKSALNTQGPFLSALGGMLLMHIFMYSNGVWAFPTFLPSSIYNSSTLLPIS